MRLLSYLTPGFPPSLFTALADAIGAEVDFDQSRSGPAPGDDPFGLDGYDLAWMCSTAYVGMMVDQQAPGLRPVGVGWVPADPAVGGEPVYFSDLVVVPGSGIGSFADLAGRRLGCNDRSSLSGFHAFVFTCRERGHDPGTFVDLVFTGSHRRSLDALLDGDIDVAAVDSIVRTSQVATDNRVATLQVIERLGPWPVQPLVAGPSLSDDTVTEIRDRLLAAARRPDIQDQLRAASLTALVEVAPDHYQRIHQEMGRSS